MLTPNKRLSTPPSPSYPSKIVKPFSQTKILSQISPPSPPSPPPVLPHTSSSFPLPPTSILLPTSLSIYAPSSHVSAPLPPPSTLFPPPSSLSFLPNFSFNLYEPSEIQGFLMKRVDLKLILRESQKMAIFLIPSLFKPETQDYFKEILQIEGNYLKGVCCLDSGGVINEIFRGNECKGKI